MALNCKRIIEFFYRPSGQERPDPPADKLSYKRAFNRFPIEFEVVVTVLDGGEYQDQERSELHDVSGGGAMFISKMPEKYYPGQHLKLDIFLAGTEDVRACIKTEASVVRIHQLEADGPEQSDVRTGIAVKFHKPFEFERIDGSLLW